jgi:hypothetical protein
MTFEERKKIYLALSAPFGSEAIERSQGKLTGRGYDTTGIKVQFIINRLNEVLGPGGWRARRETVVREINTSNGRKAYEATSSVILELGEWTNGTFVAFADAVADGGHVALSEADARKGSYSNALKKAAAMVGGVGRQAYEGSLDDDNVPVENVAPGTAATESPKDGGQGQRTTSPATPARNRLTSKQLNAVWALARRVGYQQQELRSMVKTRFGVQPEFLTRDQASQVIAGLATESGNGNADAREPGQEG